MGLEAFSFISQLVATNPVGGVDEISQGDNHLRGIKLTLQNTFPNANAAINPTVAEFNRLVGVTAPIEEMRGMAFSAPGGAYALAAGDIGKFLDVNGNITLGALVAGFAALLCNTAGGSITITASSGNLQWLNGGGVAPPTGVRTLARGGVVTVYRDGTNWRVFGVGLS